MTQSAPSNGIWFVLAGFVLAALVVVVIELRARRHERHTPGADREEAGPAAATGVESADSAMAGTRYFPIVSTRTR